MTIKSIPEPFLVQWRKREKNSDRFQPINVNADEFIGSSCSFPHPVLVVKQREQLENFYFQIKIKNYIGTCTKTVQGIRSIFYIYTYIYYVSFFKRQRHNRSTFHIHQYYINYCKNLITKIMSYYKAFNVKMFICIIPVIVS